MRAKRAVVLGGSFLGMKIAMSLVACSKAQQFCDGSHKGGAFVPTKYTADESRAVYFCGCKQSRNAPLCDGSHKSL